jgi:hypothetical protein
MNGFLEEDAATSFPIDHIFVGDTYDDIHGFEDGSLLVTGERTQDQIVPHRISRNIHVMNKKALLRVCDRIIHAKTS